MSEAERNEIFHFIGLLMSVCESDQVDKAYTHRNAENGKVELNIEFNNSKKLDGALEGIFDDNGCCAVWE